MSVVNAIPLIAAGDDGYSLTRSLRFRSSASAYLSRTPATASNRKTWTWSGWVKRGKLGTAQFIFSCYVGSSDANEFQIEFTSSDTIEISAYSTVYRVTSQVFRDPAAWYHIALAVDTTQATAANRLLLYINGVQVTAFSTNNNPSQNTDFIINSANEHHIGYFTSSVFYFDGYMAEVNFIDGQALAPTAFGTFNSYGVWQPITYGGSYGTNGFRLPFTNNASTTTLGYDFSPQGNNWTTNNISVTTGSSYDSTTDVPTLTSATAANFCTWNPVNIQTSTTISEGNLKFLCSSGASYNTCAGTIAVSSGKWYWELTYTGASGDGSQTGILASTRNLAGLTTSAATGTWSDGYAYSSNGNKVNNGSGSAYGATYTTGDVIGVALDLDAGTLVFYKNNTSQGTAYSSLSGSFVPSAGSFNSNYYQANFGQRPFSYTPPTGYLALNTFNL